MRASPPTPVVIDAPADEAAAPEPQSAHQEVELKFRVKSAADLEKLARSDLFTGQSWTVHNLKSIYFDTAAGDLRQAGFSLRLRSQARRRLLGLKWPSESGASFARGEIEVSTTKRTPDLAAFGEAIAATLFALIGDRPLLPQFEVAVRRRSTRLVSEGSEIELALDRGDVKLDGRRVPICEIELELKAGPPLALFDAAFQLSSVAPLRLGLLSKAEQGYLALTAEPPASVKATEIDLALNESVDEAIAAVLTSTVQQFTANWPCLEHSDQPEAIHQMRVGLRRLRVALGLFRRVCDCPQFAAINVEAKRMASLLGEARDWDVFAEHVREGPLVHLDAERELTLLLDAAEARRVEAYAKARDLIDSEAATQFVLQCHRFIAARQWRMAVPPGQLSALSEACQDFAACHMSRLRKRAVKRGRQIATLSPDERHEVRIILKKLRYTSDFFASVFDKAGQKRRHQRVMSKVQDTLGAFNDMATARRLLDLLDDGTDPLTARAAGLILGWTGHAMASAEEEIAALWHDFKRAPQFWT
jgi:triphosphatase